MLSFCFLLRDQIHFSELHRYLTFLKIRQFNLYLTYKTFTVIITVFTITRVQMLQFSTLGDATCSMIYINCFPCVTLGSAANILYFFTKIVTKVLVCEISIQ